jgi:hypothetical protein
MAELFTKTYSEQLREIAELYRRSQQPWPATARQIAVWAINNGHYRAHHSKIVAKAAEEFASAMRVDYYTDPQGRRVRALHVARVVARNADGARSQRMLWDDIRHASRDFMERAFQLRRRQIVGDCKQLKTDVDSFNDNRPDVRPIQLLLDFSDDVAEANEPAEYRPRQPR